MRIRVFIKNTRCLLDPNLFFSVAWLKRVQSKVILQIIGILVHVITLVADKKGIVGVRSAAGLWDSSSLRTGLRTGPFEKVVAFRSRPESGVVA